MRGSDHTPAACGLKPKLGWGGDLFEDEMDDCSRCLVALGACRECSGEGRVSVLVSDGCTRHYSKQTCTSCSGEGWRPESAVAHGARPLGRGPAPSDAETISDVVNDSTTKAGAVAAMKIVARGRDDVTALVESAVRLWDQLEDLAAGLVG